LRSFPGYTNIFFILLLSLVTVDTTAQVLPIPDYPKDYFQWPLGLKPEISANYGEMRPNHFHMGLDIRTAQKQNQPVSAAAEGYIARVRIEPSGFGRCIYINHPNGLTTLYAHLNDFFPELEDYIKKQQYLLKNWRIDLEIPANLFPVTKGQFIAFSGNTGASQGPHVHFEIRNTATDKVLNPLLFGFAIEDSVAPNILKLAVYDRRISTYEQNPKIYSLKKVNGEYTSSPPLLSVNTDKVSFAITAVDRVTGSSNPNGIFEAVLFDNEEAVVGFQVDNISYAETRDVNAHIDHKFRSSGGSFLQHVSKLPGYNESIYKMIKSDGVISLEKDSTHQIRIDVKDPNGNTSVLRFNIRSGVEFNNGPSPIFNEKEFRPGFINVFENDALSFFLPENCLYDSIRFRYAELNSKSANPLHQVHTAIVPIHGYFTVRIKGNIPPAVKHKTVMLRYSGSRKDFKETVYNNGWYAASFREFGNFQLLVDTIPPVISPVKFKEGMNASKLSRLAFNIADNSEELKNFTATLDGNWIRFSNDKGRTFIYVFDEMCPPGEHELVLSVEDCVGNRTEKKYHFTR